MQGVIERRLLVNYAVDPGYAATLLPAPFRPTIVRGCAVAGVCLMRLAELRPRGLPRQLGIRTENAAHRFAVEWDGPEGPGSGVFIPRRDTASTLTAAIGRFYPGEYHRATFDATVTESDLHVGFASTDGSASAAVEVTVGSELVGSKLFADLNDASQFFEHGSVGYSPAGTGGFDGLELQTPAWRVEAGIISAAASSFFDDPANFPTGTATLDCALVMRDVAAIWRVVPSLAAPNRAIGRSDRQQAHVEAVARP